MTDQQMNNFKSGATKNDNRFENIIKMWLWFCLTSFVAESNSMAQAELQKETLSVIMIVAIN